MIWWLMVIEISVWRMDSGMFFIVNIGKINWFGLSW